MTHKVMSDLLGVSKCVIVTFFDVILFIIIIIIIILSLYYLYLYS